MSISFNNYNYIFNKPLVNISGYKAVLENKKDQQQENLRLPNKQADLEKELSCLSELNKATIVAKQENDSQSEHAASCFENIVQSYQFAPDELLLLYGQYALQVSNSSPDSKEKLTLAFSNAMFNAFKPIILMDDQSKNAITNFKATLDTSLTKDEMVELFVRFSREISINFPDAWKELENILSDNISNAFSEDKTMDDQSKAAITGFKGSINPNLNKDDMIELFIRFSREISIKYPDAWKELENILSDNISNAFNEDKTMDDQSKAAISGFKSSINPNLSKDDMIEFFIRFSREISIKYPDAWKELSNILSNSLAVAYVPDDTMDNQSRSAISNFRSTINPNLTKDEMVELFIRFSREISVNYPEAWRELETILTKEVPNAFKTVTTVDDNSKNLASEFVSRVSLESLSSDELETLFGEYLKQISLKFVDSKKEIESSYEKNLKKSEGRDKQEAKESTTSQKLVNFFKEIVEKVNDLDEHVSQLSSELANSNDKEEIRKKLAEIGKVEAKKEILDFNYNSVIKDIGENKFANGNLSDDYKSTLSVAKDAPSEKLLQEKEMSQLSRWDMLREMRRKEVLGILNNKNKDELVEQLSSVPKFILKRILLNQVHDNQCDILMEQRYPEALLRSIPMSNAKKQLPKAEDMLPILMMSGKLSNGQNGMDLIKGVIIGGFKAEKPENQTKAREEIIPFIANMLLNKPPKAAELLKSTQNIGQPKSETFQKMVKNDIKEQGKNNSDLVGDYLGFNNDSAAGRRDNKVDKGKNNKNRLPRLEMLSIGQLLELAREKVDEFTDDQANEAFVAKRGSSQEICEFLESLDKVDSLAGAKIAVGVLYNYQQQILKQAVIPFMDEKDMVKLTLSHGKSKEEMVKDMPWYTIQDQIKNLPKIQMMDSFKKLDQSEIIGAFKQLPSQVIASIAYDAVDRTTVTENLLNQKGFAAA